MNEAHISMRPLRKPTKGWGEVLYLLKHKENARMVKSSSEEKVEEEKNKRNLGSKVKSVKKDRLASPSPSSSSDETCSVRLSSP